MYKEIDQTPYKQEINTKNLIQCWKECMAPSSYTLRKAAVEKFNSENYWKKKGLVMIPLKYPVGLGAVAFGQVSSSNRQIQKHWGSFPWRWIWLYSLVVKLLQSGTLSNRFFSRGDKSCFAYCTRMVTSILARKLEDLASTLGPGFKQLNQLTPDHLI